MQRAVSIFYLTCMTTHLEQVRRIRSEFHMSQELGTFDGLEKVGHILFACKG
jgi:hypothetical protein